MTLETLVTFLTIENNNMNNYIVTFEYRVMVTAFAILAMFVVTEVQAVAKIWTTFRNTFIMACSRGVAQTYTSLCGPCIHPPA